MASPSGTGHDTAPSEFDLRPDEKKLACGCYAERRGRSGDWVITGQACDCQHQHRLLEVVPADPPVAVPGPASEQGWSNVPAKSREEQSFVPASVGKSNTGDFAAIPAVSGSTMPKDGEERPGSASVSPAEPQHKWVKAPASLLAAYVCSVCGRDSMVKFYGRCSGAR